MKKAASVVLPLGRRDCGARGLLPREQAVDGTHAVAPSWRPCSFTWADRGEGVHSRLAQVSRLPHVPAPCSRRCRCRSSRSLRRRPRSTSQAPTTTMAIKPQPTTNSGQPYAMPAIICGKVPLQAGRDQALRLDSISTVRDGFFLNHLYVDRGIGDCTGSKET